MAYFVVVEEQGPSWNNSRPMRDQEMWTEHAEFVNSLMYAGFVILGGPLGEGTPHRAQLIISSGSALTVRTRLAEDPWVRAGILRVHSIEPWKLLVSNDKLGRVLADITKEGAGS